MSELEILAQLKIAYLSLEDILENQDKQITKEQGEELGTALNIIATQYRETFKFYSNSEDINFEYKKGLFIAPHIYYDYLTDEKEYTEYLSYRDLDKEEKWWEDYDFLTR